MPRVMGILNTTPDSFSDGGRWAQRDLALRHALEMVHQGAEIIDVGGESTRPGARAVSAAEETDRVVPVIEAIVAETDTLVSIDSSKAEVMSAAVQAGAGMVNDVCALQRENALETVAGLDVPVCLMHMQGEPRTMQADPSYGDVVVDVMDFLQQRIEACSAAGIPRERVIIDPGFGFGKTQAHNLALFRALPAFAQLGCRLLVGVSRKTMLGTLTGREVGDRVSASVTAAVLAAQSGADILRVHDVAETVDALKVLAALAPGETGSPQGE